MREQMRIVLALVFMLLGQEAVAQQQCLDALQRLDTLQLMRKFGQTVFRCEPSGGWSVSVENQTSAPSSQGPPPDAQPDQGPQPKPGVAVLQAYKRALCVAGPHAKSDILDNDTREQLRQFVAGDAWTKMQDAAPELDASLRGKLDKAVQLFPECDVQNGQIRNAYELGVYSRAVDSSATGIKNVEDTLGLAATKLEMRSARTGRPAIESVRAELERRNLLGKVDVKRDQLDDKLWPVIVACAASAGTPELPGPRAGRPGVPC
jgi:hypothetical protein